MFNLSPFYHPSGSIISETNRPVISRYCPIETFWKSSDNLPSFCRNLPIIINRSAAIVNDAFPQSIDNPSRKLKNPSTGKKPIPWNSQIILRLHAEIFRPAVGLLLSESSDNRQVKSQNRQAFFLIRQLIVNQYAVIVKWINGSNRPVIDRRDLIIGRSVMFRAIGDLKMTYWNRQRGWFSHCPKWPLNHQPIINRITVFINSRLFPACAMEQP